VTIDRFGFYGVIKVALLVIRCYLVYLQLKEQQQNYIINVYLRRNEDVMYYFINDLIPDTW
jgi:hypothetical protein